MKTREVELFFYLGAGGRGSGRQGREFGVEFERLAVRGFEGSSRVRVGEA